MLRANPILSGRDRKKGSLHRAAVRLNISQSALSRQMQTLEHELGGSLLERSTTGVKPTAGGHALVLADEALPRRV